MLEQVSQLIENPHASRWRRTKRQGAVMLQITEMLFQDGIVMADGSHGIPKDVTSLGQLQVFPLVTKEFGPVFAF